MTVAAGTNHVQLCKSFPEHVQCHAQIVKDLKQRDDHDKIQDRETVKRSLQSGEPNDEVDVELLAKRLVLLAHSRRSGQGKSLILKYMDFQWVRAAVSASSLTLS